MFTSVTNYLFGTTEPEEKTPEVNLQTTPAKDDDWLIVDLPDKTTCTTVTTGRLAGHSPCSSDSDTGMVRSNYTPSTSGSSTPNSRFFVHMHESWILTPPPCFTAGGSNSTDVQMTEMENLLIEHPSMSVYNSHCSRGSTGEESDLSESSNDSVNNVIAKRGLRPRNNQGLVMRHPPKRPNAVAARCGIVAQVESQRVAQRAKQYHETRKLTRSNLNKLNKVTHQHTKKFSHKNRIQTPTIRNFANKQMKH